MKKILFTLLAIISTSLVIGQGPVDSAKKSKDVVKISETEHKVVQYFANGMIKSESFYADNQPNGTWLGYNESGAITTIQNYKAGTRVGNWVVMSKDGLSKYVTKYENNKRVSVERIDGTGNVIASR